MATLLSNSAAVKAVANYMRLGSAAERPFDATVIDRLVYAGALLGPKVIGGSITNTGSTGATKLVLQNHPLVGLLNLIIRYNGGQDTTPLKTAVNLILAGTAVERLIDEKSVCLIAQFAKGVSFPVPPSLGIRDALRDAPVSTLIFLLYWVGTLNPANPYKT